MPTCQGELATLAESPPEREAQLRRLRRSFAECDAVVVTLATLLTELRRPDEAIALLAERLREGGERARFLPLLIDAHLRAGENEQAELVCQQALHQEPNRASTWNRCGLVDLAAGRIAIALQRFERAYTLDPEFVDAWINHGQVALDHRDFEEAERLFAAAIEHQPDRYDALVERGIALRALGRLDEARFSYERAISIAPSRPEAHYDLGLLYVEAPRDRMDLTRALGHFQRFLELAPRELRAARDAARAQVERLQATLR